MSTSKALFQLVFLLGISISLVQMQTAQSIRARFNSSDFKFDLKGSRPFTVGGGGNGKRASLIEMPSLKGVGISYGYTDLEPCGIVLPHIHPRATEMIYAIQGRFQVGFVEENEGRAIINDIGEGETHFFPQGLIHFEQNLACTKGIFLSAFTHEDPGALSLPNRLFSLPTQAITSSFNNNEETLKMIQDKLVVSPAAGVGECRARCGLN